MLEEVREHWGEMQGYLGNLLRKQGMNKAVAEEMAIIPGMEEVVSLLHINKQAQDGQLRPCDCRRRAHGRDDSPAHHARELPVVCGPAARLGR